MAKTDPINVANPDGSESPTQGDNRIRALARALIEIFDIDHYVGSAVSNAYTEDAAGEHAQITGRHQASVATPAAGKVKIWFKTANGFTHVHITDDTGDEKQLTSGNYLCLDKNIIANNTALKSQNTAGDGTVDMIKYASGDYVEVADGARVAASTSTGDPDKTIATKDFVEGRVAAAVPDDDAFGSWASKSNNTVYQADTDGFVCAYASTDSYVNGYTDSNNPPTTKRVGGSSSDVHTRTGSVMMPVKKNDYYKVTGATNVFWIPIGA
jgi:hypothetical protein